MLGWFGLENVWVGLRLTATTVATIVISSRTLNKTPHPTADYPPARRALS
jgi:hypothetical protein